MSFDPEDQAFYRAATARSVNPCATRASVGGMSCQSCVATIFATAGPGAVCRMAGICAKRSLPIATPQVAIGGGRLQEAGWRVFSCLRSWVTRRRRIANRSIVRLFATTLLPVSGRFGMGRYVFSLAFWLAATVGMWLATASPSSATGPLETSGDVRWIVFASRQDVDEAIGLARRFGSEFGAPTVLSTTVCGRCGPPSRSGRSSAQEEAIGCLVASEGYLFC
jgi:hypothetical protein